MFVYENARDWFRESLVTPILACTILGLWLLTAYWTILQIDLAALPLVALPLLIGLRTFLHTGLFILAHDAMHGTLNPASPRLNAMGGQIFLGLYSFLSYPYFLARHQQHHRTPAQADDPDFYEGSFWEWYLSFMLAYVWGRQGVGIFWGMSAVFYSLIFFFHAPMLNLACFWLLPQLLSSLQLFYFGTYRPHRRPGQGYINEHRAVSSQASTLGSFLSCYHFDYHWEHHQYPHLPWYRLPSAHH